MAFAAVTQVGEAFAGSGAEAAHVNTVLGRRGGPVETAWATALATPRAGHVPFVVVLRPNLPVQPPTLFVNKATLGGDLEVPTLEGRATIKIPAATRGGQRFRLKGRGVAARAGHPAGHLYAVVQIVTPKNLDARSHQLLEEFARLNPAG
mgnify:CR=1 FL=1